MARGRVITPDFWSDGNMVGVSAYARLFYIGMWNYAYCDKGHLPDDAVGLKLKVLPADDVDPEALLAELMGRKRVVRVEAEGRTFLFMPTFEFHQKADQRWKTRCPACALSDSLKLTETQESLGVLSETHQTSALREEKRKEQERKGSAPAVLDRLFDEVWVHWPKKTDRKTAADRFRVAARKVPAEQLAESVRRFGDAYARTTEKQFVPALGVWLGRERWTDELPVGKAAAAPTPTAPRDLTPAEHAHKWLADGSCVLCTARKDREDTW